MLVELQKYQVVVWRCPDTRKLFTTEAAFLKQRAAVRREKARRRAEAKKKAERKKRIAPLYLLSSFEDIAQWIMDNIDLLQDHSFGRREKSRLSKIWFENMRHGEQYCSHSAPKGKQTNWGGMEKDLPTQYAGFGGTIRFEGNTAFGFTRCLQQLGIHTGTGSAGWREPTTDPDENGYRYGVTLWEDDFPVLSYLEMAKELADLSPLPEGITLEEAQKALALAKMKKKLYS